MLCKGCISFRLLSYTQHMNNRHTYTCQSAMEFICCQLVTDLYIQFILFKLRTQRIGMIILVIASFYHPVTAITLNRAGIEYGRILKTSLSIAYT